VSSVFAVATSWPRWLRRGAGLVDSLLDRSGCPEDHVRSDPDGGAPLAREVWRLAWPAITHMLLVTLMFLVGRVMVGRYSPTALASLQVSGTLVWSTYSVFTAFSTGTLAVVARSIGAGDRAAAAQAARSSLLFAALLGVLVMVPIRLANGSLLRVLFPQASPAVLADASAYLHIVLPCLPLAFIEAIAAATLQGAGNTRAPLYVATVGNVVNGVLSYLLIFGRFGFPELGVRGAAVGHAATMSLEGLLLLAVLVSKQSPLPLRGRSAGDLSALRRVLRVAWPAFGEKAIYQTGFLGFIAIIGLLGTEAMAANQALLAVEAVGFLSADGFGIAAAAVIAQKLGAQRPGEATRAGWLAAGMSVALATLIGLSFVVAPRLLMKAFSTDPAIISLGSRTLYVAAVAQPFMAYAMVKSMALRGAGATRTVLLSTCIGTIVVRLAATYLFAITLGLGLVGVWLGSTLDWVVRSALLGSAYARGSWRAARV
jgi:multidrug resistance protein, MATE family